MSSMEYESMKQQILEHMADQGGLMIYCLLAVLTVPVDIAFVAAFLGTLAGISFSECIPAVHGRLVIGILYLAVACLSPVFLYFLPVILYSILSYKQGILAVPCVIVCAALLLPENRAALFFVLAGCFFAVLLRHRSRRYEEVEEVYRRTRDDEFEKNLSLKETNRSLLERQDYEVYTATLRERNRIAREIHDNVGHLLSRSILMTGAMKAVNRDPGLDGSLEQLEDTLGEAMTSIRSSVHDLRDESVNLKEVLNSLVDGFTFCQAELIYDMGYDVPREIRYGFIMVTKEALNNVIRHSDAAKVSITAREHPGLYQLIIKDDGTVKKEEHPDGMGIRNMQERIRALGGRMQILRDGGFGIFIVVPKIENEKEGRL